MSTDAPTASFSALEDVRDSARVAAASGACMVVHPQSVRTAGNLITALRRMISRAWGGDVPLHATDDPARADVAPGSVVFLIGDRFTTVPSVPSGFVVYINLSVVYPVRQWWTASLAARRWMASKRRRLLARAPQLDLVLDFYPPHARALAHKIACPVLPFLSAVDLATDVRPREWEACEYDVCVVGAESSRRRRIHRALQCRGVKLSPLISDDFEQCVAASRIVLNVHFERCDNQEIHRLLTAMALEKCVVSEPIYEMSHTFPPESYVESSYRRTVATVLSLLKRPESAIQVGLAARAYVDGPYRHRAERDWRELIEQIKRLHRERKDGR